MLAQGVLSEREAALLPRVVEIWREVLGCAGDALAADSNFFLCGGDSLQLMRVLVRVRERLGVDLPLHEAARFSSPEKMAACCAALSRQVPRRAQSAQRRLMHEPNDARFPCTAGQAALWLAEQCSDGTGLYNAAIVVHFAGALQVPVLARAFELLLERHEVLRATLHFDSRDRRLFAVIGAPASLSLEPTALLADEVWGYLHLRAAQPFDFAAGPLWRIQLVTTGPGTWSLLICIHHCITDGWSGGVLLRHLAEAYNALLLDERWQSPGRDSAFRDFCVQLPKLTQEDLHWWRTRLDGADRLRPWPYFSPQQRLQRWPFAMSCLEQTLDAQLIAAVHAVRRVAQVELSACLLAALRLAVHALTGIDELCIGMPVSLRNTSAQEDGVGYFVNLLVLRERIVADMDGVAVLQQAQRNLADALCHRAASLPELARQLRPRLLPSGNPWCDIVLAYQNLPWELPAFAGLQTTLEPLTLAGQYPLKVEFIPAGARCLCRIEYAHDLFTADEVRALQSAIRYQLACLSAPARNN